jgi:hypothetical protein
MRWNDPADAVDPGDSNRPKSPLGRANLACQHSIPPSRQMNVLVHTCDPFMLRSFEAKVKPIRGARAVLDCNHLVHRARLKAWRATKIRAEDLSVRDAGDERERDLIVCLHGVGY